MDDDRDRSSSVISASIVGATPRTFIYEQRSAVVHSNAMPLVGLPSTATRCSMSLRRVQGGFDPAVRRTAPLGGFSRQ